MFRVGFGQDSHRFSDDPEKKMVLAGVTLPDEPGCEANSDGDVVIHALCNALEQAIGGDSFSTYADTLCRQGVTDSKVYLQISVQHVRERGYDISNIGISIEASRPKITPVAPQIRASLAAIMGVKEDLIGINATSGEGMTPFGRGEGIQAFAIVSLIKQ